MSKLYSSLARYVLTSLTGLVLCSTASAVLVVNIGNNFTGSTFGQNSSANPPDSEGAAGPNHFVEFINGRFAAYDKSSGNVLQSFSDLTFWSRAGVTLPNKFDVSDPRIIYDPSVQRWFASAIDFDPSGVINTNQFLLAISTSADPTGGWNGVSIPTDPGGNNFADFPTVGVDAQGVYLSGDMFDPSGNALLTTSMVSIPKSDLLATPPSAARRSWFNNLSFASRGSIIQPVVCTDGTQTGDVLGVGDLGLDFLAHSTLIAFNVVNSGMSGASLSAPVTLNVTPYLVPIDPPQPDGSTNLNNGDTRFSAMVRCVGSVIFAVHNVEVNNRAAIRWYRLNAADFTILESGTIADADLDLFYPSIAANTNGTVVVGCNGSSTNTLTGFVSAYAVVGQTVNGVTTFGNLMLLHSGTAAYQNTDSSGTSRWGDYSATTVDPADPTHFWTIQMYAAGPSTWSTQISELITAPLELVLTSSGTNVVVSWPSAAAGFQLQSTDSLGSGGIWTPVGQSPATNGNSVSVLVPTSAAQQFFRLVQGP